MRVALVLHRAAPRQPRPVKSDDEWVGTTPAAALVAVLLRCTQRLVDPAPGLLTGGAVTVNGADIPST